MAQHATELFMQCVYSLDLSYHELLEKEAALKLGMTRILEEAGGEFIHFEEMGDTMRIQCVLPEYGEELFHPMLERIAPLMDGQVECRVLFVHKDLSFVHIVTVSGGAWQESCLHLPAPGPLTRVLRDIDPPSRQSIFT